MRVASALRADFSFGSSGALALRRQARPAARSATHVVSAAKQRDARTQVGPSYVTVAPDGSDGGRALRDVADAIKRGEVGVIPTDTIYAIVCDVENRDAVEKLYKVKQVDDPLRKPLSLICRNFEDIDRYTEGFPVGYFRVARAVLPGPYTLILPASKTLPKNCILDKRGNVVCKLRRTVGVRMPDDPICQALLQQLDRPLLCTSVRVPADSGSLWLEDPADILDQYARSGISFVLNGGVRQAEPSTVIDLSVSEPKLLRQGKGDSVVWGVEEMDDA